MEDNEVAGWTRARFVYYRATASAVGRQKHRKCASNLRDITNTFIVVVILSLLLCFGLVFFFLSFFLLSFVLECEWSELLLFLFCLTSVFSISSLSRSTEEGVLRKHNKIKSCLLCNQLFLHLMAIFVDLFVLTSTSVQKRLIQMSNGANFVT